MADEVEEQVAVVDLQPGDHIDLYGDPYADPDKDPGLCYEYETAEFVGGARETADTYRVDHSCGSFGCPPDHQVKRTRRA
jgi:hypothetical protein